MHMLYIVIVLAQKVFKPQVISFGKQLGCPLDLCYTGLTSKIPRIWGALCRSCIAALATTSSWPPGRDGKALRVHPNRLWHTKSLKVFPSTHPTPPSKLVNFWGCASSAYGKLERVETRQFVPIFNRFSATSRGLNRWTLIYFKVPGLDLPSTNNYHHNCKCLFDKVSCSLY